MRLTFSFTCTQMTQMWDVHSVGKSVFGFIDFSAEICGAARNSK